jgi:hypothetical protein
MMTFAVSSLSQNVIPNVPKSAPFFAKKDTDVKGREDVLIIPNEIV